MRSDPVAGTKVRLVYILSASHSGSTLLAMSLGSHPEIATVGELKMTSLGNPDEYRCSCRKEIRQCPFWIGVMKEMGKRGFSFDIGNPCTDLRYGSTLYVRRLLRPLHRGRILEAARDICLSFSPAWRSAFPQFVDANATLASVVLALTGKNVLVDSSKTGTRLKYLMKSQELDVKVIRLIRDGRGVALTYVDPARFADAKEESLRGGGTRRGRDSERLSLEQAAREWRRSNEEAEAITKTLDPSRWKEIRYENFCADPESTILELCRFIGVSPGTSYRSFRETEYHVVGNGMRFDTDPVIELDERWRTQLTKRDLGAFDLMAGKMNRKMGYL